MTSFTCSFICITCKVSVENSYFKGGGGVVVDIFRPYKFPKTALDRDKANIFPDVREH